MTRLSFIYLISFILLCLIQGPQKFHYEKPPEFIQEKRELLRARFEDPGHAELLLSYVVGDYKRIPKEIKEAHKILGLNHLFTPSGIHLSALFILFFPLLFWLKKKHRPSALLFGSVLYLLPLFILPTSFGAAKRISLLRFLGQWKSLIPYDFSYFYLFIVAFVIDFFLGGFKNSPGSFVYSFLFLGILFSADQLPKIFLPFALLSGQIMVSFFQQTPLTPLGFLLGFFLTALFTPFFPIYFFYFWSASFFPAEWGEFFIKIYLKTVFFAAHLAQSTGLFFSNFPLILLIFTLSLSLPHRVKVSLFALFFILQSQPLINARSTKDLRSEKSMLYARNIPKRAK